MSRKICNICGLKRKEKFMKHSSSGNWYRKERFIWVCDNNICDDNNCLK
jgi:hypothetical protein